MPQLHDSDINPPDLPPKPPDDDGDNPPDGNGDQPPNEG